MDGQQSQDTTESIAREYNIDGLDESNPKDKALIGVITRLRAKNRELTGQVGTLSTQVNTMNQELEGFRRSARENELMNSVLGDKLEIRDMEKFNRWKTKLPGGDNWEADFKQLVADFAVEKQPGGKPEEKPEDKTGKNPAENPGGKSEGKPGEQSGNKPETKAGYTSQHTRGSQTEEISDTAIRVPKTPSEKLRLMAENPEAYREWRASRRRR